MEYIAIFLGIINFILVCSLIFTINKYMELQDEINDLFHLEICNIYDIMKFNDLEREN